MDEENYKDCVAYWTDRKKTGVEWRMDATQAMTAVNDILLLIDLVETQKKRIAELEALVKPA